MMKFMKKMQYVESFKVEKSKKLKSMEYRH